MLTETATLPGYSINEYLLVIQPHEELCNKIKRIRQEFNEKYETDNRITGKANITIARFSQMRMMEERIINRLRNIATAMPAFKVELKNFGSLPTHSIYLNIETKTAIQGLVKQLKSAASLLKAQNEKPHFPTDFYITIARELLLWQYEKGWLEMSNTEFTASFIASHLLLLRKGDEKGGFSLLQKFEFMNAPVLTTQGVLF